MAEGNGLARAATRSKQLAAVAGLVALTYTALTWFQVKAITEPAARAATTAVTQVVRAESDTLRALIRGEGAIRDAADTTLWRAFALLREEVRAGVYSKHEIDRMRQASYQRQDSLFRESLRQGGRR